ncbi:MAG: hypothetical protein ISR69_07605 [Gammaproteobacteria bacterium]|nr:hypothetical protein [Gammaproteobacteria bacterium]
MKYKSILIATSIALTATMPMQSFAASDDSDSYEKRLELKNYLKKMRSMRQQLPLPPAAGMFGVYAFPEEGQFVTGINLQNYQFTGLIQGENSVSAESVVTSAPNFFAGDAGQPPTLRVVPKSAEATVIFPFINYSLNKKLALVALAPLIKKETTLEVFQGGGGTTSLGTNTVKSSGLGDIKFGVLYKLYNEAENKHNVIIDAVLSAPTGDITVEDNNLTPMNTIVKSRLAYGMQLGSGTWDALVGVAYWGKEKEWGWGAQYLATIPLEDKNDEGWRYGDKKEATAWLSYEWQPTLVSSVRLRHETQGEIEGVDTEIYGAGLGANPENYGGKKMELSLGVNWMYQPARNISVEYSSPVSQDRNGVQAEQDKTIMVSWRNAFF